MMTVCLNCIHGKLHVDHCVCVENLGYVKTAIQTTFRLWSTSFVFPPQSMYTD